MRVFPVEPLGGAVMRRQSLPVLRQGGPTANGGR